MTFNQLQQFFTRLQSPTSLTIKTNKMSILANKMFILAIGLCDKALQCNFIGSLLDARITSQHANASIIDERRS